MKSCTDDYIDSFSQTTKKVIGDYYVFLDENLIDHSDFLINDSSVEDSILYYSEICRFFRFLENKYGIEVVIAAHPRANLDKTRIRFPGHKVLAMKHPAWLNIATPVSLMPVHQLILPSFSKADYFSDFRSDD